MISCSCYRSWYSFLGAYITQLCPDHLDLHSRIQFRTAADILMDPPTSEFRDKSAAWNERHQHTLSDRSQWCLPPSLPPFSLTSFFQTSTFFQCTPPPLWLKGYLLTLLARLCGLGVRYASSKWLCLAQWMEPVRRTPIRPQWALSLSTEAIRWLCPKVIGPK